MPGQTEHLHSAQGREEAGGVNAYLCSMVHLQRQPACACARLEKRWQKLEVHGAAGSMTGLPPHLHLCANVPHATHAVPAPGHDEVQARVHGDGIYP